jgi:hypothetical protein
MSKPLLTLALAVGLATPVAAQDAKPDFSGTWTLDIAKSDFGPAPPPESMVLVVEHKEPAIKVKSTQRSAMGEIVNERNLTTDGKSNSNKIRTGDIDQVIVSTSKWDGRKVVTSYTFDIQGNAVGVVESWDVSTDGKVLTVARDINMGGEGFAVVAVFNKK